MKTTFHVPRALFATATVLGLGSSCGGIWSIWLLAQPTSGPWFSGLYVTSSVKPLVLAQDASDTGTEAPVLTVTVTDEATGESASASRTLIPGEHGGFLIDGRLFVEPPDSGPDYYDVSITLELSPGSDTGASEAFPPITLEECPDTRDFVETWKGWLLSIECGMESS